MVSEKESIMMGQQGRSWQEKNIDHVFNWKQKAERLNWKWNEEAISFQSLLQVIPKHSITCPNSTLWDHVFKYLKLQGSFLIQITRVHSLPASQTHSYNIMQNAFNPVPKIPIIAVLIWLSLFLPLSSLQS